MNVLVPLNIVRKAKGEVMGDRFCNNWSVGLELLNGLETFAGSLRSDEARVVEAMMPGETRGLNEHSGGRNTVNMAKRKETVYGEACRVLYIDAPEQTRH